MTERLLLCSIVIALVAIGLVWCVVRYWFISVGLSDKACLVVVWFKWPVAAGSAIYLLVHRQFLAGVVALLWPLLAGFTILPGQIGVIELRLAKRIGYVAPDAQI